MRECWTTIEFISVAIVVGNFIHRGVFSQPEDLMFSRFPGRLLELSGEHLSKVWNRGMRDLATHYE